MEWRSRARAPTWSWWTSAVSSGSVPYGMSGEDDLAETQRLIEEAGRRAVSVIADVRDAGAVDGAVRQALDAFGHIDVVAANAGISTYGPLWEFTEEEWEESIGVNLTGVWHTVKSVVPHMIEPRPGRLDHRDLVVRRPARGFACNASALFGRQARGRRADAQPWPSSLPRTSIRSNVVCPLL